MSDIEKKEKEELIKKAEENVSTENSDSETPVSTEDEDLAFTPTFKPGEVAPRSIVDEMKSNYIDYSMSVIVSRALPEIKDGLKPSQRRILVAMNDLGLNPTAHYRKCAKIAGDTSGNYHPHGESVVYPTLVKLAQEFSTRYPLVDGQGNFGCFTKDTKIRLADGRSLSFGELIKEEKEGKKNYTFTVSDTGEVKIALIEKPRLTIKNAEIMTVVLDNGKEIRCTLNHRFLLKDKTYVEAQDLKPGVSLMPLYTRESTKNDYPLSDMEDDRVGMELIANHKVKDIVFTKDHEDVYDLTISDTHNFSLDAGVFVHNSIDGDPAAAMRYTEARMGKITPELLRDLNKGTVTYIQNYDGTRYEPTVLPALFPNLLANGSQGIAVGMATQIPPHNLGELIDALLEMIKRGNKWEGTAIYNELRKAKESKEVIPRVLSSKPEEYLESYVDTNELEYAKAIDDIRKRITENGESIYPDFKSEISPEELIEIIPGPDFPTGSTIYDRNEILNAYATGRGRILQRANASIVEGEKGRYQIVLTEVPYQVNKAHMIEKIADLVKDKKIEGISDIRDESNKDGIRVVIVLKKDAQPKTVLNKLYKYTEMQKTFNANMISLVENEPITLPLRRMLELFLSFRLTVTIRRYEFDLAEARYHAHILEGLLKALDVLDEVIATIRQSKTQDTAKTNLMDKFKFTDVQAQAILDMQLRRLAALERMKLQNDYKETKAKIIEYNEILESQDKILNIISTDLEAIKERYGDKRRTKVVKGKVGEISEEDLIAKEETLVTITNSGYVKRLPPNTYHTQKRGGKGVSGGETKEGDFIEHAFLCSTHDELLLFTNRGRVFNTRIFEIPEYGRTAKGIPLINLVQLDQDEKITSILTRDPKGGISAGEKEGEEKSTSFKYFTMATSKGIVKKTEVSEFEKIRSNGLTAIKLESGDELSWVRPTTGNDDILIVTADGKSIMFSEKDVRAMGRSTRGVTAIKLKSEDDFVVGMGVARENGYRLFTLSENGYGKMTKLNEYPKQKRGGTGVFTFRVTPKTGRVVVARVLDTPEVEIVVISEKAKVIRSSISAIPTLKRQTSGVKIMNMGKDDRVATMALI